MNKFFTVVEVDLYTHLVTVKLVEAATPKDAMIQYLDLQSDESLDGWLDNSIVEAPGKDKHWILDGDETAYNILIK